MGIYGICQALELLPKECKYKSNLSQMLFMYVSSCDQELWMLLKQTRKEMLQLLQDWPFIQPTFSLVCSHCLLHRYDDPYHYPGEVMEMSMPRNTYVARWCRKYEEQSVPACFVYPLDIGQSVCFVSVSVCLLSVCCLVTFCHL